MKALSHDVKTFAQHFWRAIGTPLASELSSLADKGMWDTIASCKVDPKAYTSAQEYFLDASAASLLRKYKDLPTSGDRRRVALENWRLGEVDCFKTNERLNPYFEGWSHPAWNEDVARHIDGIREKISSVLGRCPPMEELRPRHGPGATYSDKSVRSTLGDKMQNRASITHGALWFLLDWVGTAWGREALKNSMSPEFVRGNRFTVAPKDATKDRPIAAEPSVNIFYQLALGELIRRRLKRVGIDILSGQDIHRSAAKQASIDGLAATLDLKNASDTVAFSLVKLLLPPDWFRLLSELRSPFTRMDARDLSALNGRLCPTEPRMVKLEKFSSMGNGFTFELETLLFWAISDYSCEAVVGESRSKTLVYGDDIICDTRGADAVASALRFFGFTINEEKSFVSGSFRESCGGDFWDGRPVRPYFQKDPLDEPHQLIAAANQVRRLAQDLFGGLGPLSATWYALQAQLPSRVRRCRGPDRLGDVVLHDDEVNWAWTSSARTHIYCWRPVKHRRVSMGLFSPGIVLALGLYGEKVSSGFLTPRDSVIGHEVRRIQLYGVDWLPSPPTPKFWVVKPTDNGPQKGPSYDNFVVVRRSTHKRG